MIWPTVWGERPSGSFACPEGVTDEPRPLPPELAAALERAFLFESTVMDGAPVFGVARAGLPAAEITSFRGVLNSTTNYILTQIETGASFEEAVQAAQAMGLEFPQLLDRLIELAMKKE